MSLWKFITLFTVTVDADGPFPVALVISSVVTVIVIGFTVGLVAYVICKAKR